MRDTLVFAITWTYFLIGAAAFAFINRKLKRPQRRSQWSKYFTFFLIVHAVIIPVLYCPPLFLAIVAAVIVLGAIETAKLPLRARMISRNLLLAALIVYGGVACAFLRFVWRADQEKQLWLYLTVFLFDAFSQISGQLLGKHKLAPGISPNKTIEGAVGGFCAAVFTVLIAAPSFFTSFFESLLAVTAVCAAALVGDLTASYYKRLNGAKDFSNWLPGQGGILDRFDGFLVAGAMMGLGL